jgi:hypothetical protein
MDRQMKKTETLLLYLFIFSITSCASSGRFPDAPQWVSMPDKAYPPALYITAVGYGNSRGRAESSALRNLTAQFGQSVQGNMKVSTQYAETVTNAGGSWTQNEGVNDRVVISTKLDTLIGAKIQETWENGQGVCYALAVMDRAETRALYSRLIMQNEHTIRELLTMTDTEKYSFAGLRRYHQAAQVASVNESMQAVMLFSSAPKWPANALLYTNASLLLEANAISAALPPVYIETQGDKYYFFSILLEDKVSRAGLRVSDTWEKSGFTLSAVFTTTERPKREGDRFIYVDWLLELKLTDNENGEVLVSVSKQDKAGHASYDLAQLKATETASLYVRDYFWELGIIPYSKF